MVRRFLTMLALLAALPAGAWGATFEASVDRHQLTMGEKLTLTLRLLDADLRLRAEGVDPNVDLSVLHRDFDVGVPRAGFRYNIYKGRGRSTSEIVVELYPRRPGRLVIPPFRIEGLATAPIEVEVKALAADQAPEVFMRAGSSVARPWQGQQLVVFIDLYNRVELKRAKMADLLTTEPTRIELLAHWELPRSTFHATHLGFDYEVLRLAWAIFPDRPGPFTVHLPAIEAVTTAGRELRFPHQSLEFDVRPLPEGVDPAIIIGRPRLDYEPLPSHARQHEAIEWRLTLSAPVGVSTLPDYLPLEPPPEGIRRYAERARRDAVKRSDGIIDRATYAFSLMPLASGEFTLPEIAIPYFDPETGRAEVARVPPRLVIVEPAPAPRSTLADGPLAEAAAGPDASSPATALATLATLAWLSTGASALRLRRRLARLERKEPAPATLATPAPAPSPDSRLKSLQPLLTALGARTLDEAIERWRRHHGDDDQVAPRLRALQRLCYGPRQRFDEEEAARLARQALEAIEATSDLPPEEGKESEELRWLDETFRPRGGRPEGERRG